MLEVLGIDEQAEKVYRLMLRHQNWRPADLARELKCSVSEVEKSLDRLVRFRLLRGSLQNPARQRAVSPEVGLRLVLQQRESELLRQQQELADGQAAVLQLIEEYANNSTTSSGRDLEHLQGVDAIQQRLEELTHRCERECLSFMPGGALAATGLEAGKPLDQDLLSRGRRVRTLCMDSVRNDQATLSYAQWLTGQGGEVRTAAMLPLRMMVFDRESVLMPLDPENAENNAVLIRTPSVITMAAALFELTWDAAAPFGTDRDPERNEAGLTPQEAGLLRLLHQGNTDEVAARKLGIGLRTVRRMMSDLMSRLDARSRFEAGAQAVQRGWLP